MRFEFDDGGRKEATGKKSSRDCVARAVAIASGIPYAEVYRALADGCASEIRSKSSDADHGVRVTRTWFKRYMKGLGFRWTPTMGIGTGCRVHLKDGELPMGRLVVNVSRHMVAVIDGVIRDTHNPSRGGTRCVYGYWAK